LISLCLTAILPPCGLASQGTICLASRPPSSSFGIASAIIFILPHKRYHGVIFHRLHGHASLGNSIFYFASLFPPSGQYYLLFGPSSNIIFYFAPQPRPSGDTIFYSTQRPCHSGKIFVYLAPRLRLSKKNASYNPSGLFASGFCELPWCPFLPGSSRIPFIGIGVAYLVMPCDEQPFASFLMLTQGFHSLVLVLLLLQPCGQITICIHLMHTHIPLTPSSRGMPPELVFCYGYMQLTY